LAVQPASAGIAITDILPIRAGIFKFIIVSSHMQINYAMMMTQKIRLAETSKTAENRNISGLDIATNNGLI
jgi:hypothetical protein